MHVIASMIIQITSTFLMLKTPHLVFHVAYPIIMVCRVQQQQVCQSIQEKGQHHIPGEANRDDG